MLFLRWMCIGYPMVAVFFAICGIMTVLYLTVWKQERRMRRYDHRAQTASLAGRGKEVNMRIAGSQSVAGANTAWRLLRQNVTNSRKVLKQGFAYRYVGAFLRSYTFVYIYTFISMGSGESNGTVPVLHFIFYPLQGKSCDSG